MKTSARLGPSPLDSPCARGIHNLERPILRHKRQHLPIRRKLHPLARLFPNLPHPDRISPGIGRPLLTLWRDRFLVAPDKHFIRRRTVCRGLRPAIRRRRLSPAVFPGLQTSGPWRCADRGLEIRVLAFCRKHHDQAVGKEGVDERWVGRMETDRGDESAVDDALRRGSEGNGAGRWTYRLVQPSVFQAYRIEPAMGLAKSLGIRRRTHQKISPVLNPSTISNLPPSAPPGADFVASQCA
jgi:hypothetical protein